MSVPSACSITAFTCRFLSAVLGVSLLLEGASLLVAIRSVREGAEIAGLSFMEYVKRGIDPTSVAVMMEDAGACAGLIVAGRPTQMAGLACCFEESPFDMAAQRCVLP
jgi:hypothetical protein